LCCKGDNFLVPVEFHSKLQLYLVQIAHVRLC
jgi:hypothetical protein